MQLTNSKTLKNFRILFYTYVGTQESPYTERYLDFVNIFKSSSLCGIQVWYLITVFFEDFRVLSGAKSFHVSGILNKLDDNAQVTRFAI